MPKLTVDGIEVEVPQDATVPRDAEISRFQLSGYIAEEAYRAAATREAAE